MKFRFKTWGLGFRFYGYGERELKGITGEQDDGPRYGEQELKGITGEQSDGSEPQRAWLRTLVV